MRLTVFLIPALILTSLFSDVFEYQEISVFYNHKDRKFAEKIASELYSDIDDFQRKIGSYPEIPVKIIIARDKQNYRNWIDNFPQNFEFSQGFYNRNNQTIFIRNPRDLHNYLRLRNIILHEYIHLFIDHYWEEPPLWFNEGMAVYFSRELDYRREYQFIKSYIWGNSPKLTNMEKHYPENKDDLEIFYAKSALAVKFMFTKYRRSFYELWENEKPTGEFGQIFLQSFFLSQNEFSELFEEYCQKHFRFRIILISSTLIWAFLPLILIIGFIKSRIRNRKLQKTWKLEENLEKEMRSN